MEIVITIKAAKMSLNACFSKVNETTGIMSIALNY
jgi:hypothetical protein